MSKITEIVRVACVPDEARREKLKHSSSTGPKSRSHSHYSSSSSSGRSRSPCPPADIMDQYNSYPAFSPKSDPDLSFSKTLFILFIIYICGYVHLSNEPSTCYSEPEEIRRCSMPCSITSFPCETSSSRSSTVVFVLDNLPKEERFIFHSSTREVLLSFPL